MYTIADVDFVREDLARGPLPERHQVVVQEEVCWVRALLANSTSSARTALAVLTGCENASRIGRGPMSVVADISKP